MSSPRERFEAALKAIDTTIQEACSCRNVKQRGCMDGECDCNKAAFLRGGILLPVPCKRQFHQKANALRVALYQEMA